MNNTQHKKLVESVCKKLLKNSILSEADTSELNKDLQDELLKIKTKEDLKKFMQNNADEIKTSYKKADKKSKPFYKKAWDWLCKAAGSTANFIANNMGTILVGAGILYAGHAIGWNNIKSFFTGKDDKERDQSNKIMKTVSDTARNAIHAVNTAKNSLSPEQQKRVFNIREQLPDALPLDKAMDLHSALVAFINPDKALRMDTEKVKNSQKGTYKEFMALLDKLIKTQPDKVDEFLDRYEEYIKNNKWKLKALKFARS